MSPLSGRQSGRVAVIFVASTVNQEVQRTETHHAEAHFGALHLLIFLPFWLQILPPLKRLVVRPVNDIGLKHTSTQKKGPYLLMRYFTWWRAEARPPRWQLLAICCAWRARVSTPDHLQSVGTPSCRCRARQRGLQRCSVCPSRNVW